MTIKTEADDLISGSLPDESYGAYSGNVEERSNDDPIPMMEAARSGTTSGPVEQIVRKFNRDECERGHQLHRNSWAHRIKHGIQRREADEQRSGSQTKTESDRRLATIQCIQRDEA